MIASFPMSTTMRGISTVRRAIYNSNYRSFSSTHGLRNEVSLGAPPVQKRPIGGFRGGIIGFLFGFSLASSYAAYHLLEEYQQASAALQASVEELKLSTEKVSAHVRRIEAVEKELKVLTEKTPTKDDVSKVRAEMKKLYDGLHVEFLDLRTHVWGMQQDLHSLSKKDSTSVRV
ncbi:hypothetical protein EYR40_009501 [Pleurotus pulmonarius]|nr:hypothetical protein EYR38_009397 [Pleurotus pulmonarius]KAF4590904.1 hypothetical protein EYR40_009501 [Pleurotus pulmonarius]